MDLQQARIGTAFNPRGLVVLRQGEDESDPTPLDELEERERAALAWFTEHEDEVFDSLVEALKEHVAKQEEARKRKQNRLDVESAQHKAALLGEVVDETAGLDVVEDEVRALFDDPEEVDGELDDEELEDEEPFWASFDITTLVLVPNDVRGTTQLGFVGRAEWEAERGLGVLMDGLEGDEIGPRDLIG